jgi:hypothetical protein
MRAYNFFLVVLFFFFHENPQVSPAAHGKQLKETENERRRMQMDTIISNDLADAGGATNSNPNQYRRLLTGISMYEVQPPIDIQFKKGNLYETVSCLHSKDEVVLNDLLALLNDLVPGKESETIYNVYKKDARLQKMLLIRISSSTRNEKFAKKQKLALYYILQLLNELAKLPAAWNTYDSEWDRPTIYRLNSLREHVKRALSSAVYLSTQDTVKLSNGVVGCKKYLQVQTLVPAVTGFLKAFSHCTNNNFKSDKVKKCKFNYTFPDLYYARVMQYEKIFKNPTDSSALLEESMSFRSSHTMNEKVGERIFSKMLKTKPSAKLGSSLSTKQKNNSSEQIQNTLSKERGKKDTVAAKIPQVINKSNMPVLAGEINVLHATELRYEANNIVHDDKHWYILTDAKIQDQHEGWTVIPPLNATHATQKGYVNNDVAVYADKVYILDDVDNQDNEKGWIQVAYGKNLTLLSDLHTNMPFVDGEFDPEKSETNGYVANSIVYIKESGSYYILTNEKHQTEENSWKLIEPLKIDFASESRYNANDVVLYKSNLFLLKNPFDQTKPESWIGIPRQRRLSNNKIEGAKNAGKKTKQSIAAEIRNEVLLNRNRKSEQIEKYKMKVEAEKALLTKIATKMSAVRKAALKTTIPHRFPTDKCVYHAFTNEPAVKKLLCGVPSQINLKDGINVFEISLPAAGLNPYTLNSTNFKYGITDRCGLLQNYLTFSVRDSIKTRLPNGGITIMPPRLVGELDCYNHDCQIFMCNQVTGMARVVSGNLYVYRKEDTGSHSLLAEYEINAKGSTFSFEYISDIREAMARKDKPNAAIYVKTSKKFHNETIYSNKMKMLCENVNTMMIKLPFNTPKQVIKYIQIENSMTIDEIKEFQKVCKLNGHGHDETTKLNARKDQKEKNQYGGTLNKRKNGKDTKYNWIERSYEC